MSNGHVRSHVKLNSQGYNIGSCPGTWALPVGLLDGKPESHLKVFVNVKGHVPVDESPAEEVPTPDQLDVATVRALANMANIFAANLPLLVASLDQVSKHLGRIRDDLILQARRTKQ